jgi:DNA-binding IclR family transcriptional regulator
LDASGTDSTKTPAALRAPGCEATPAPGPADLPSPSRTLEKGLQVLSLFDVAHPEWTFKAIREKAGLPKATGFRLVKTLENLKFLVFDPKAGVYRLGSAMMKAAYLTQTNEALVAAAEPFMQALARATTETVDLSVPTDQGAMIVHTLYTDRPVRPYNPPGMTMTGLNNVHCKLFVAFGPEFRWEAAARDTVPRTASSLVDPTRILEELAQIRSTGIAFGLEEHKLGMCAVGAPVFDSTAAVRACVAVVVPVERFEVTEREAYAVAVREAAAGLSLELGHVRTSLG